MEPFIGMIAVLPYNFAPRGWAKCDGQIMSIQQNSALFALLGTNFGGDGHSTFGVPKLASPGPNLNYYIALEGMWPTRN